MITITSYLHREILNDIVRRWMYGEVHPSDAAAISRLVNFNNVFVCRYLQALSEKIFSGLHAGNLHAARALRKGDLKDIIVSRCPYRNPRIDDLIRLYLARPEGYYRETPFHAILYFIQRDDATEYVGSCRLKRVRRLAEKVARKIIDRIFSTIKQHAETLADERARHLGIPREQLVTPPEEMTAEFLKAEEHLLEDFRNRRPPQDDGPIMINDVAGIKLVLEDDRRNELFSLLDRMEDCEVIEEEHHRGRFKAINLLVRYRPSRDEILARPLGDAALSFMRVKGLSDEEANRAFSDFVKQGEDTVCLEIILSNYEDMLESEIGLGMHEDRIIDQRRRQQYRGCLARNIEYLMMYLFTFPASPQQDLPELPIKLWNRYLPDYFDEVMKELYRFPQDGLLD